MDSLLRRACEQTVDQLKGDLKMMKRVEPAISSDDEQKQLRLCYGNHWLDKWAVYFRQTGKELFTMEEMQTICRAITFHTEALLGYGIFTELVIDIGE